MQLLIFIISFPILWVISILPFRVLYAISDVTAFILRVIVEYRKKVIIENLKLVFPEKTETEINKIVKQFYTHFSDLFLEMIKTLSISKKALHKRFVIKNPETLKQLDQKDTSTILMFGHYASYEWSSVIQSHIAKQGLGVYKAIENKYFDKLVRRIRAKYNTQLASSREALKTIKTLNANNEHRVIALVSDQSPRLKPNNVWLPFMGVEVPCFYGAEKTAKAYNFPVCFLKVEKVNRGFYEAEFIIISENPSETEHLEITKTFIKRLELQIKNAPQYYLWTHKRWKHRNKKPPQA